MEHGFAVSAFKAEIVKQAETHAVRVLRPPP
jgi:hypothetical protein